MQRIIVIVVMSVLSVVLFGCDKIKTELECRHLGAERHKQASQIEKSLDDKSNNNADFQEKKQIVIRIDLPADEKFQIRLVKLPVSEVNNENGIETTRDEENDNKNFETGAERNEEKNGENEDNRSESPKSEKTIDNKQEQKSAMRTDDENQLPAIIPASEPRVVVPERESKTSSVLSDTHEAPALSRFESQNPASAEAAVDSALTENPARTTVPAAVNELSIKTSVATRQSLLSPWAIPNAEYPLRYY